MQKLAHINKIPDLPLDRLKLKDFSLTISEIDLPAQKIEKGLTASGRLYYSGTELGFSRVHIREQDGYACKMVVKPFDLGLFKLTGAGIDRKYNTKDDGPAVDIAWWPYDKPPFNLQQHFYISGRTKICELPADALIEIGRHKLEMDLSTTTGDVLSFYLTGHGGRNIVEHPENIKDLDCSGEFRQKFVNELESKVRDAVKGTEKAEEAFNDFSRDAEETINKLAKGQELETAKKTQDFVVKEAAKNFSKKITKFFKSLSHLFGF